MLMVNTDFVTGKEIAETLGVVRGSTIRAKHLGKDFMTVFRMLVGGELKEYSELIVEARNEAIARMQQQAEQGGADAIINVRFMTSQIASGAAELLAYGTAVRFKS